jgi:hypothetical protein
MYIVLDFGYKWDTCKRWSVLATCVTPVSLWPLITMGSLGAWSCLHAIIYYTCRVLYVLRLVIFSVYYYYALLLRR